MRADWNYPTAIRFGPGRLCELADACRELGMDKPLLVTDPGLARSPMVERAAGGCPRLAIFSEIQANPTGENVARGVEFYREAGCDGVIALGGGSSLDAGKAIALMIGQGRPLWDFEDREDNWKRVRVEGMPPVVAVPTTSGTGSEVGRVSIITDTAARVKRFIFHPRMLPQRVIADPELTLGLPPGLTAAVGMDALSHCLEAYCSPLHHPMADGIAAEGLALVRRSLLRAYRDGADLEARADMLAAAMMGATAFQKGLGAVHSLSHPLGAHFGLHHGLLNGILTPYVLEFNRPAVEGRLSRLSAYLGLSGSAGLLDWILELRREMGIPHTLAELGLREDEVLPLAGEAARDPSASTNPVPVDEEAHRELFRRSLAGDVSVF
ncbi:MAG: iron-containing alcohol dehydrogenase [Armatimonadetes bacterium]|nr:iron-containing alcohol dehydrogenase [Armatimonadota bacterium]